MKFKNDRCSLEITPVAYEFPERTGNPEDYDFDANWLVLRGVYREGKTARSFENSCLLTGELQALSAGLKLLCAGVKDFYESGFMEPYFEVAAERLDLERYLVAATFSMLVTEEDWQSFSAECFLSRAELKTLIGEIDAACAAFPEKKG